MNILFEISFGLCLAYVLLQTAYLLIFSKGKTGSCPEPDTYPSVTILLAARNEAANITDCLKSLHALEYPEGKLEILIGNDQSTDYTGMLCETFIADKPAFRLLHLSGNEFPQTKGKARVLATLAEQARGDYFLITDADTVVPPQWAKAMVSAMLHQKADLVAGCTNVKAEGFFQQLQQTDWLYFMGVLHAFANAGIPLTAVGNNMGVSRKAYESTGGYGKIPFSLTEDYALFSACRKLGFRTTHELSLNTLVYTRALRTVKSVLKQRKRWLTGGMKLPLLHHIMIFIFGSWYLALPLLLFFSWEKALVLFLIKDSLQLLQLLKINRKLEIRVEHPKAVLLYEFYLLLMVPLSALWFLLPTGNTWKGRRY